MSYYNKEPPTCKYCSTDKNKTLIRFKKKEDGGWLVLNPNGTPHDRDYCKAKKEENLKLDSQNKTSYQPNHQARISTASPAPSSTFSRDEDVPKAQGVTIFSLHVVVSELRKEIKELRKQIETLASITDSTAQKTELLINKVGYPAPQPALSPERQKAYEENSKKFDAVMAQIEQSRDFKCNSCGAIFTKGIVNKEKDLYLCQNCVEKPNPTITEIKAQQRHPTQEELANSFKVTPTEVINPMRVAKEEVPKSESDIMQWQNISEAFICHSCDAKTHNGFIKLGTRLCPQCKDKIEANESEDEKDRSDVNEFRVPRSIEEINEDL